ncbi:CU044_2847 family protein [Streptomyces sp. NPDC021224]|uniref:CU044_2847 family protein n=1 Tax=unclassified Streptomyces TaxID=2593676 RepID=UPI0037ACD4BB
MAIVRLPAGESGGTPFLIEVDGPPAAGDASGVYDGIETRANPAQRVMDAARDVYGDGLDLARRLAEEAARRFAGMDEAVRPAEIEMQLAVKLDATLGAFLVQSGAEAQLQVTFRWTPGGGTP